MELETGIIDTNQGQLYYERSGSGIPLIFIHGAFADMHMFDPQWDFFIDKVPILRFDLRGHGKSVPSKLAKYSMETFIDDLAALMNALDIPSAIICGQSWGGSIAQGFASQYPQRVNGLVLAGSMVSMSLTMSEKIQRYVLVPKWLMLLIIRSMNVQNFVKFSFHLADIFFGKDFLSQEVEISDYIKTTMVNIDSQEYLKIWEAIYNFEMFPLERIICSTLILNGEYEPKRIFHHTKELLEKIPNAQSKVIPKTKHSMNLENATTFNHTINEFISSLNN